MENLNDRLIKSQLVRSINMIESGGGREVWEDITSLFTVTSSQVSYSLSNDSLDELIGNRTLRITIEVYSILTDINRITGTIQLYSTKRAGEVAAMSLLTNTVYSQYNSLHTGRLILGYNASSITYNYGISIPEAAALPKILKVERLMGV